MYFYVIIKKEKDEIKKSFQYFNSIHYESS